MGDGEGLLLRLLEEVLETGRTAADVCAAHPQLAAEVHRRVGMVQAMQGRMDELFPASPTADTSAGDGMPEVPGYAIECELGRGGMGVVYRARQESLQRLVALKMMLAGPFATPQERLRFRREAELVAQLHHPNIVPIHDVGDCAGRPYYTMELIDGPSLAQRPGGLMPVERAAALVATLALATEYAHQQGIVHRDLKPANVLLAPDGTPRITDFGLARRTGVAGLTASGVRLGTPSYMAPEQALGSATSLAPAVDVYALGAILYELLAGKPPFRAETPTETMRQVLEVEAPRPMRGNVRMPRDLETICQQCLRKEPHRRYASAQLLAADLQRFAAGDPILGRRTGGFERLVRRCRRRPGMAIASGGIVVLALALLAIGWSLWWDRAETNRAVAADLRAAGDHARQAAWPLARTALASAAARLGDAGPADLRAQLADNQADLELALQLERVRFRQLFSLRGRILVRESGDGASGLYGGLLAKWGLADQGQAAAAVAARVRVAAIRPTLLAALDDWAFLSSDPQDAAKRAWLMAVAGLADPDADTWRQRVRDVSTWSQPETLQELAATADLDRQPVPLLLTLADRMQSAGLDSLPLLRRVLARHPDDIWANFALGLLSSSKGHDDGIRYLQAAVALRPDLGLTNTALGMALAVRGRDAEAEAAMRRAIEIGDGPAAARFNLARMLLFAGRVDEAIREFELGFAIGGIESANVHAAFAHALLRQERFAEAEEQLRLGAALDAHDADLHNSMGLLLHAKGDYAGALLRFDLALQDRAGTTVYLHNKGRALLASGRVEEAVENYRRALEPGVAAVHDSLANALREAGRIGEALAAHREAVRLDPQGAESVTNLGVTLAIDWQYEAACDAFQSALRLDPKYERALGALTQALLVQGRFDEAIAASKRYAEVVPAKGQPMAATMLRTSERMRELQDRLPGIADGSPPPFEALMLAGHCSRQGQFVLAARLWTRALAAASNGGDDLRAGPRHAAAIAALQAGLDQQAGNDTERRAWRDQSLAWLEADFAFKSGFWPRASPPQRLLLERAIRQWLEAPALAPVRDAGRLLDFDPAERTAWMELWRKVSDWLRSIESR